MGDYLATRIFLEFSADVVSVDAIQAVAGTSKDRFASTIIGKPDLFNCEETNGRYIWKLKPEILEQHLYPFLKEYYKDACKANPNYLKEHCGYILSFLKNWPAIPEIFRFLRDNFSRVFGHDRVEHITSVDDKMIPVHASAIRLTMGERVFYEEIHSYLKFFEQTLRVHYDDNPLSSCLVIDVN